MTTVVSLTRRRALQFAALCTAPLFLASCASPLAPNERRLAGRFSVSIQNRGRRENQTGRFALAERPSWRRLDLLTPLGGILVRIEETPQGAFLWRSLSEAPAKSSNLDKLLLTTLGFTVPVAELSHLAWGGPDAPDVLQSGGWNARILSRTAAGNPQRLRFERAAGADGSPAVSLTLFIEHQEAESHV